jgi:UDP-glucose:(heptosyl)LPS alpha-1,3-glucosyltransferase
MKIAIAIEKFDPKVGGAERYCWDLAHFLAGKGHDVAVICIRAAVPENKSIRIELVPVIRFPQGLRHLSFALMHYLKARSMTDYIHFCVGNTFYMDVYQPHGGLHKAWFLQETLIYPDWAREYIRFARRCSLKDIVQRLLEWVTLKVTKPLFIAISEKVKKDAMFWFNYPSERIRLVPNGIDTDKFTPENRKFRKAIRKELGISDDEYVFLFVAQNMRLKGYDILKQACSFMSDRKFKVLAVGNTEKNIIKTAPPNFIFAGKRYDLEKIYPACDSLVHPTYYDACSLVVLEALASGTPVITTSANGAAMFIKDGLNGYIIKPGNVAELVSSMKSISANPIKNIAVQGFKDSEEVFMMVKDAIMEAGKK